VTFTFIRHYAEMILAMSAGMLVLGLPIALVLDPQSETIRLLDMGVVMTVPMVVWMRYRGHGRRPCVEMAASMFVPTFAAIGLLWSGALEFGAAMTLEHVVMFPAMLIAMLLRRDEYTGHAHRLAVAA
jgi:hypothetical protein